MNGIDLLIKNKEKILMIAAENGLSNVRIFGSTARGEDHSKSDIDFLVQIEDGRTLFDLIRFKHKVEELVGRKVDVVSDQGINEMIKENILNEVVQL